MSDSRARLRAGFAGGIRKGWGSFLWIAKIVVPVSFAVAVLQWGGWLQPANVVLRPVMGWLHLPAEAALPIMAGMLINIYACIASMSVIPFTTGQMTLIAVFTLICHNLIVEGVIQHRSGIGIVRITLIRIAAAVLTVLAIAPFLGDTAVGVPAVAVDLARPAPLAALRDWSLATLLLLGKVLGIIMLIMVVLEVMRALGWSRYLEQATRPLMKLLGLEGGAAALWVTAVVFGLMYGGAVIQEGIRQGELTRPQVERLHVSVGINHSMIEDPALFMAMGLNGFWLWVPKLLAAVLFTHAYRMLEVFGRVRQTGRGS